MAIAYASNGLAGGISGFIPILFLMAAISFLFVKIARRKGKNPWLWFFVGLLPVYNVVAGLWLASLPDEDIIFTSYELVPTGKVEGIRYIILVDPDQYRGISDRTIKLEIGRAIGRLNKRL